MTGNHFTSVIVHHPNPTMAPECKVDFIRRVKVVHLSLHLGHTGREGYRVSHVLRFVNTLYRTEEFQLSKDFCDKFLL